MLKKLLISSLLLLSVLGCNNNVLNPDDFSKEEIDKKYPYWQVGISRFEVDTRLTEYTIITVQEKRFTLRCMALIRLAVNTPEFVDGINAKKNELISGESDSYGGHTLKSGDQYDPQKIIDIIRSLKYNFVYVKMNTTTGTGEPGSSRYLRYGLQPENEIPMGKWVGFFNGDWDSGTPLYGWDAWRYGTHAGIMFHEHMHNIGFADPNTYKLDGVIGNIASRVIDGDLKDKYYEQLEELTAYYFTEYKNLLNENTIFDPNIK